MLFKRDYPWFFEYLALPKLYIMSVPQFNKIQHLYLHMYKHIYIYFENGLFGCQLSSPETNISQLFL